MPDNPPSKKPHSLADHVLGEDMYHTHDDDTADHDHDHDHFDLAGRTEDDPLWQADHVELTSVGIDIGSAGTQVVFSRLAMQRMSEELSSRYHVVSRETLHRSPVALTPYKDDRLIDERALAAIIDDAYGAAGVHPDDVDTGVVILTGEALRRENAKTIADVLADAGGEFVCASAGHHMEAMLAAFGSGAAKASHDRGERLLNVDIGGGTTKLAIVERGKIIATAALHIGGRLLVVDAHRRIVRLEPAGRKLAAAAGFDWSLGDVASDADVATVAQFLADTLIAAIIERPLAPALDALYLTEPIDTSSPIAGVMFSGGVAEYVYRREARDFGDWGRELGAAIAAAIDAGRLPWPMLPAGECIRATALGASEYSVQLSGNTCYISAPGSLLPRHNLQVLQPDIDLGDAIDADAIARAIERHFERFDLVEGEVDAALAFRWRGAPSHARLAGFAHGIASALARTIERAKPLYLILDGDVAQTLGTLLRDELGVRSEILAIDGIMLWDFDYIDLGRIRMPSNTVPVTIKSLVFNADPRTPSAAHRGYRRHVAHRHPHSHPHAAALPGARRR